MRRERHLKHIFSYGTVISLMYLLLRLFFLLVNTIEYIQILSHCSISTSTSFFKSYFFGADISKQRWQPRFEQFILLRRRLSVVQRLVPVRLQKRHTVEGRHSVVNSLLSLMLQWGKLSPTDTRSINLSPGAPVSVRFDPNWSALLTSVTPLYYRERKLSSLLR